ncbi:TetR/AcrR family transcriptional regulator [Gandjariella thermophila]|uniref:TetR family transcriptional regulator n=1 Tax=Gandjariella thermophila TaxID=1931992 RepID=A0A4D4JER8_9PSEU|nr:TetR family transcriptional regulator [Gandjariella thermophila]GDY33520.1 TetR family transcriptional regulator [Gandjariella thermophila]
MTAARRRGRRPAGEDTRAALLEAAGAVFAEQGYDGSTVRAIAARAGVDPAMVNHWFGGKEGLFAAAMELPIDPGLVVARVLDGSRETVAERIVRTFVTVWDDTGGAHFAALVRSVSSHELAARMLREFVTSVLFGPVAERLRVDQPDLRAALCGSQIVGLGMIRYVVRLEPLASADVDTVVAAIGPNLQRYLTGDLGLPPDRGR